MLGLGIMLLAAWTLICNNYTYKHRTLLLDEMLKHVNNDSFYGLMKSYNRITYEQHLWRLIFCRWNWRSWYEN